MSENFTPFAARRQNAILVKAQLRMNRDSHDCGSGLIQKTAPQLGAEARPECSLLAGSDLTIRSAFRPFFGHSRYT